MFNFFHNLSNINFIAKSALLFSHEITYFLILTIFLWAFFQKGKRMFSFSIIFLAGIFSWIFANIFKIIFKIDRPFMTLDIIPLSFERGYSFPSEHVSIFFALSFVIFFLNRKLGIIFYVFSFLISISRLVLGVHYPIDILGGIFLGTIIGFLFVKLFKRLI